MPIPFWEQPLHAAPIAGAELTTVLTELCERRHPLLLATPYLAFESRFLDLAPSFVRIQATMGRDVVKYALAQHRLRLRFAWGLAFLGGATRVLEYEQEEASRHLRISLPERLAPDDVRRAYRVERVGHSTGTLGAEDLSLVRVSLEDLSPLGAGVFCLEPIPQDGFQPGRAVRVSLTLDQGPQIEARALIVRGTGQNLGLAFQPPLEGRTREALLGWLQPRQEQAQKQWENRATLRAQAALAVKPQTRPEGVLLVSRDPVLMEQVSSAVEGSQSLRITVPAMAPFKEAMATPPLLLLLHLVEGVEERHRLRALLESLPLKCPVVILGRGQDAATGRQFATEMKAATYLDWNPQQDLFFKRLVQGLIRRHWGIK